MRADVAAHTLAPPIANQRGWSDPIAVAALILCVSLIYGARLSLQPLIGEETRWATAAREMLATGDWIVPRQQGQVFPERPPMTMWLMAVGGWLRGDVDPVAARLPSVIATVLTSLLIFGYARAFTSTTTALIAALVFATGGQVLQIGRRGESEAVFALFVSASLLLWHLGYARGWRPLIVWSLGCAFAALAALVKGPQAPVYFGAITIAYLAVMRDWRYLISWQVVIGSMIFVIIIAAWQVPFYWATDWASVEATWAGLAGDRIHLRGVLSHLVTYPVETVACLLPWSPMLFASARRDVRAFLRERHSVTAFLVTAILVAYPTVWLAAGARGRYFMPLYPLVAVLIGMIIGFCSSAPRGTSPRRRWHEFLLLWGVVIGAGSLFVGGNSALPNELAFALYQPRWFEFLFSFLAAGAVIVIWISDQPRNVIPPLGAVFAIAGVAGLGATGLMMNVNAALWNDPTAVIARLANQLPAESRLVSLSAIDHRFAYYYRAPITELPWPRTLRDVPPDVDYFCFMRHYGDTAQQRAAGRGRTACATPGTLPFAWEEVLAICTDRQTETPTATSVVLGRVVRPLRAQVTDATVPQVATAQPPASMRRK
jgi:4-amino-4-deoxy-L-arabinose transferase-like glycosyltransferase